MIRVGRRIGDKNPSYDGFTPIIVVMKSHRLQDTGKCPINSLKTAPNGIHLVHMLLRTKKII